MYLGLTRRLLVLDAETASDVDLKTGGAARYFEGAHARVLMFGFQAFGDDRQPLYDARVWEPGTPLPPALERAVQAPPEECLLLAYNVGFDRRALAHYGLETPWEKWLDIMTLAYMLGFAGKLDEVLQQAEVGLRKDPEGGRLLRLFSIIGDRNKVASRHTHPAEWTKLVAYCRQDVAAEAALALKCLRTLDQPVLRPMVQTVYRQWLMDQRVNSRGIPVCLRTIEGAIDVRNDTVRATLKELQSTTGLANPNSVPQLKSWLETQGVFFDSLRAAALRDYLKEQDLSGNGDSLPCQVIRARLEIGKASVKKLDAFRDKQIEGRIYDSYTTCGASRTGRAASRGINLANLERPSLKHPDLAADWLELGDHTLLSTVLPAPDCDKPAMQILGSCVRGMIRAPKGRGITACDLTSIESVGVAWLAGCDTVLDIFHRGQDTYKTFGVSYYGKPYEEITKAERTFCKPPVLGCGFGASGPALVAYAYGMGVVMSEEDAERAVTLFRTLYREIPAWWYALMDGAVAAVSEPGRTVYVYGFRREGDRLEPRFDGPRVWYYYDGEFLWCGLPSRRVLFYHRPQVEWNTFTSKKTGREYTKASISYMGKLHDDGGAWTRIPTHGPKLAENLTQALCRDILYHGLEFIDRDERIDLIGHTYDEAICETWLDDTTALERLKGYMTTRPVWLDERFFLGADGYLNAPRYRKD